MRPAAKMRLGRRQLLLGATALVACRTPGRAPPPPRAPAAVSLWSWFDLPAGDPRSSELSGVAWDAAARRLWAVQDHGARIVALVPDGELRRWSLGESIDVDAGGGPLDLEGIVVLPDGFLLASEEGPRIVEIDRRGALRREIPVPDVFHEARPNLSLESLTMSPDGRTLFTTTEAPLPRDEGRLRIARLARDGRPIDEHFYVAERHVSELCALSGDELLVLERGFVKGAGNEVRIYRTTLDGAPTAAKTLVVDLAELHAAGVPPAKQPQRAPLLENYEGLALGPPLRLADGPRASLFVVSDDNGREDQVARILVLALP